MVVVGSDVTEGCESLLVSVGSSEVARRFVEAEEEEAREEHDEGLQETDCARDEGKESATEMKTRREGTRER